MPARFWQEITRAESTLCPGERIPALPLCQSHSLCSSSSWENKAGVTWIEGAAHTVPIQAARDGIRALQQGWGGSVPLEQSRRVGLGSPSLMHSLRLQSRWFLVSSKPGRHSQAMPPLGVSRQMWAQPWFLFMQFIPSKGEKEAKKSSRRSPAPKISFLLLSTLCARQHGGGGGMGFEAAGFCYKGKVSFGSYQN